MKGFARLLQPRALLVTMHLPYIVFTAAQTVTGFGNDSHGVQWIALPPVLAAGGIQLRHSLAAAAGVRPRHWPWTLALLLLIACVAHPGVPLRWPTMHWFVIASLGMLLPRRLALVSASADAVGVASWVALSTMSAGFGSERSVWEFVYVTAVLLAGGGGLYGATRLVWHADELRATRAELAELAIDHERLRISRDLHDLLGQSLSAVALKGDLADRLLARRDVSQAVVEVQSLVSVARSALRDLRDIARGEPAVSLASEIDRGIEILESIGIETRVAIAAKGLPPRVDELFAWAVREGVTNVVRHSNATTCSISIGRANGELSLEIENDGAGLASIDGNGLNGLSARAADLSGSARGRPSGAGRFCLAVNVPERAA